jgi:protein-histidine pros-kinase
VSSYAATETIGRMQQQFHDYRYHVAALNPTNKRDQADPWETWAIQTLARDENSPEYTEVRDLPKGRFAFIAKPIRITNAACLACHSVPEAAPATMLDTYGRANGFGWKLNEVVAVQVVSVPMSVAQKRADVLLQSVMVTLIAAFVLMLLTVNAVLYFVVGRRLRRLSRVADRVSRGDADSQSIKSTGNDEVSALEKAFERMRMSLSLAVLEARGGAAARVAARAVDVSTGRGGWPLHVADLQRLIVRLNEDIGPMATLLVERAAAGAASREEFIARLTEALPAGVAPERWRAELGP